MTAVAVDIGIPSPRTPESRLPWPTSDVQAATFHLTSLGLSESSASMVLADLADNVRNVRRCILGWDEQSAVRALDEALARTPNARRGDLIIIEPTYRQIAASKTNWRHHS